MATAGISYELTDETKQHAIKYVKEGGLFKNRLSDFLSISRPTLDRLLKEDEDFFTALKRADAIFCKNLIAQVSKKDPIFILRTRYKEEFDDKHTRYIPQYKDEYNVPLRLDTTPCVW